MPPRTGREARAAIGQGRSVHKVADENVVDELDVAVQVVRRPVPAPPMVARCCVLDAACRRMPLRVAAACASACTWFESRTCALRRPAGDERNACCLSSHASLYVCVHMVREPPRRSPCHSHREHGARPLHNPRSLAYCSLCHVSDRCQSAPQPTAQDEAIATPHGSDSDRHHGPALSRVRRRSAFFDFAVRLIAATVAGSAGPPTAACTAAAPPWSISIPQ